ncbi:DUF3109 family protein [Brevibacillus ginsengisoli]|uniref:DUF3109 family protein n=1 Tax=Brevibacillus ginsengisoli TaxID=363854 RepID=UPI003CE7937B
MSTRTAYSYYGTPDLMGEKEIYRLKKYVKQKKAKLVESGRFLLDLEALNRLFMLDCFNCKDVHQETCCEKGEPYSVPYQQVQRMERYVAQMKDGYLMPEVKQTIQEKGVWQTGTLDTIKRHEGNCLFVTTCNGKSCCAIHAHAAAHDHDVFPVKPFSCQLYPIDLIRMPDKILITSLTEETVGFSRWSKDYLELFYCSSMERRLSDRALAEEVFPVKGYRSAYSWGRDVLLREFGSSLVEVLDPYFEPVAAT